MIHIINEAPVKELQDELTELFGEDLSLPASLATLIIENGDIRSFLLNKLREREEELARFHLSQYPTGKYENETDDHAFKRTLGMARALGILTY